MLLINCVDRFNQYNYNLNEGTPDLYTIHNPSPHFCMSFIQLKVETHHRVRGLLISCNFFFFGTKECQDTFLSSETTNRSRRTIIFNEGFIENIYVNRARQKYFELLLYIVDLLPNQLLKNMLNSVEFKTGESATECHQ